jgi:hypothetical protein
MKPWSRNLWDRRAQRRPARHTARLGLEALEARELMSGGLLPVYSGRDGPSAKGCLRRPGSLCHGPGPLASTGREPLPWHLARAAAEGF